MYDLILGMQLSLRRLLCRAFFVRTKRILQRLDECAMRINNYNIYNIILLKYILNVIKFAFVWCDARLSFPLSSSSPLGTR